MLACVVDEDGALGVLPGEDCGFAAVLEQPHGRFEPGPELRVLRIHLNPERLKRHFGGVHGLVLVALCARHERAERRRAARQRAVELGERNLETYSVFTVIPPPSFFLKYRTSL